MFDTLQIENFRGIAKLDLSGLGRVNLVMGPNNSGKTSLLEALHLAIGPEVGGSETPFRPDGGDSATVRWLVRDGAEGATASASMRGEAMPARWETVRAGAQSASQPWGAGPFLRSGSRSRVHAISAAGVPVGGVETFAAASRSPADEALLVDILRSVDPRVRGIRLDAVGGRPFIAVDIGLSERMPLSRAGLGMVRLVGLLSELLGKKPEVCFIDEIENGVHYSALPALWRGVSELARRIDIQVFATTHSWECFVAAHEEFDAHPSYDLRVIQLFRDVANASGRLLDEAHIRAAITGDIELR